MSIHEIEQQLIAAQERQRQARLAIAPKHKGGEWEEYWAAHDALIQVERELAAAKGEEHAVPIDFPVQWDVGAPLPHLLRNDSRTFLAFYLREDNPAWDGTPASLALVEFFRCASAKLGTPNDEVFEGHPLAGKGMDVYSAQRVVNSRWVAELETINKVHHCYNADRWRRLNHFVLWFHDTTFECVAESFKVEVFRESMGDLLAEVCRRLVS